MNALHRRIAAALRRWAARLDKPQPHPWCEAEDSEC